MSIIFVILLICKVSIAPVIPDHALAVERVKAELVRKEKARQFDLFVDHLGMRESNNQWDIINPINCMGKYQFAPRTLRSLGYGHITPSSFRRNPNIFPEELQDKVLIELLKSNEIILKEHFLFIGKTIKGVEITKAGILASAHLAGARNVKLFLESSGQINPCDMFGTSLKTYMNEFSIYNI